MSGVELAAAAGAAAGTTAATAAPVAAGVATGAAATGATGAAATTAGLTAGGAGLATGGAGLATGAAEAAPLIASNLGGSLMGAAVPEAGMAGGLGSGMSGIPLADGGAMIVGPGGSVGWGGAAAGEVGSGLAGVTMPSAVETASPWYAGLLENLKNGADYYNKANTAMKLASPQQQGRPGMLADGGGGQQGPRASFAQTAGFQPGANNYLKMLQMQRQRGLLG